MAITVHGWILSTEIFTKSRRVCFVRVPNEYIQIPKLIRSNPIRKRSQATYLSNIIYKAPNLSQLTRFENDPREHKHNWQTVWGYYYYCMKSSRIIFYENHITSRSSFGNKRGWKRKADFSNFFVNTKESDCGEKTTWEVHLINFAYEKRKTKMDRETHINKYLLLLCGTTAERETTV